MIKSIAFENYKAFENGSLKIKPITLLLGANSVGKSSIFQLILMLRQTAELDEQYNSALKLYGEILNLGESDNLFKNKITTNPLGLSLSIQNRELFDDFTNLIPSNFTFTIGQIAFSVSNSREVGNISDSNRTKDFLARLLDFEKFDINQKNKIISFIESIPKTKSTLIRNTSGKDTSKNTTLRHRSKSFIDFSYENKEEFLFCTEFIYQFCNLITSDTFDFSFTVAFDKNDNRLTKQKIVISNDDKVLFNLLFSVDGNLESISLPSFDIKYKFDYLKEFRKIFRGDQSLFSLAPDIYITKSIFSQSIHLIMSKFFNNLKKEFSNRNINYVGPLRAHPRRHYFLDKARINVSVDALDGDTITEIMKGNTELRNRVNTWFNKFNLEVKVEKFKDVIHSLKIKQNSLELDITDVGFGISQILPVIIQGYLSKSNTVTLIEQPEIHLHPKMQAELADLFIDIVQVDRNKRKNLVIETHSEYLIKRIRRRISEGTISAEDVGIFLIQRNGIESVIEELEIEPKGQFSYPKDFYEGEILDDTIEFLKNQ